MGTSAGPRSQGSRGAKALPVFHSNTCSRVAEVVLIAEYYKVVLQAEYWEIVLVAEVPPTFRRHVPVTPAPPRGASSEHLVVRPLLRARSREAKCGNPPD